MPTPPPITRDLLRDLARLAMSRGLPEAEAEEVVARSWEKAARAYEPRRGAFEALLYRVVENEVRYWWRQQGRWVQADVHDFPGPAEVEIQRARQRAWDNQHALLQHLSVEERQLFSAWALQKHLGKGRFPAGAAASSLGLDVRQYENAKRRLKKHIHAILAELGLRPRDLYSVSEDEGPRRQHRAG